MNKIVSFVISVFGCLALGACNSTPVEGSCPVSDFNGSCCIRQNECNLRSGNPDEELKIVEEGCKALDPMRKPLLCLDEFNTKELPDCVPLTLVSSDQGGSASSSKQAVEACMGSDDVWSGRETFIYNVFCCK